MKTSFSRQWFAGCTAALLILSACANNKTPVAKTNGHATQSVNGSGLIPTRDDRNSMEVAANTVGSGNGPEYRVPTGSNLPQSSNRLGNTTDGQDPTAVIDQGDIRLQRHDSVSDALKSDPSISVRGGL